MTALNGGRNTDVALLWNQAFIEYNETVGEKGMKIDLVQISRVKSVEDVTNAVDEASKAFKKYRHDGSTLDKVRSFIGGNLSYVQIVGDKVSESAAASFPPASAIWTVSTYAIKTCQTMSQDYNQLLALIAEAGNFLKTLEIIEENIPDCKRYNECVAETLIAIVGVFAVQTKFMLMKRPMAFLHTLVRGGGDGDLEKAYSRVTDALSRLSRANEIMTVKNTEDIKNLVGQWGVRMEFYHDDIISELQKQTEGIQANHQAILANQVGIDANQQGIEANRKILEQIQLRLIRSEEERAAKVDSGAEEATHSVSATLIKAKKFFKANANSEMVLKDLSRSYVARSTDWLFDDAVYRSWLDGDKPFLWLSADSGQGKSHIAFSLIERLKKERQSQEGTSVAYFFFQEESATNGASKNALRSIGLQIARQDQRYREKIALKSSDEDCTRKSISEIWKDALFPAHFDKAQTNQLILVLDGFDSAVREESAAFLEKLASIPDQGLRIKVFFTGKPTLQETLARLSLLQLDARVEETKAKILESRLETLPRVSRFRPLAKRKIIQRLTDDSFTLLYVERFLKTLEAKALERPALIALKSPPEALEMLYEQLFLKSFEGRSAEESEALRFVFSWLGACMRRLTLQELNALMVLKFGKKVLNIEDEIAGKCASILEIASSVSPEEENKLLQKEIVKAQLRTSIAADNASTNNQIELHGRSNFDSVRELPALSKAIEDDSSFVVYFQDTTMTKFIRNESNEQITRSAFHAHLDAFATCADVLERLEDFEDPSEPNTVLHNYAAFAWIKHLLQLDGYDEASDKDASLIAQKLIMIYGASAAPSMNIFQQTDISYNDFVERGPGVVQKWLRCGLETEEVAANENVKYLSEMLVAEPNRYLSTLAREQARRWIDQVTWESAEKALMSALKAYQTKDGKAFNKDEFSESDVQELVMGLDKRLVPLDHKFYRAMSMAWSTLCVNERAWADIQTSWQLCGKNDPYGHEDLGQQQFFTLYHMAVARSQMDVFDEACRYYRQALALKRPESPEERETTQLILLTLGIQANGTEGADLLERALMAAPDLSGICFSRLLVCLSRLKRYEKVVETVTRYGSLRLTTSWVHGDDINNEYQKSAKLSGMTEAMVATYQQLIYDQDPLRWASPARFYLARAYRRIVGNNSKAKELLYQILDSESCIHPANGQEDDSLLYKAQIALSEVLYEQFVSSSSLIDKAALLQEMSNLQHRQLGQKLSVDSYFGSYNTSLARMCQKLDSLARFFEILDEDFRKCMDTLQDDDPWNDSSTLRQLCKILACLPELDDEATIAMCASFYVIDPDVLERLNVEGSADRSKDKDEEEDGTYDRTSVHLEYSGCGDHKVWNDMSHPLYKCTICAECSLCEDCHAELQALKGAKDAQGPDPYCGVNHSYIKVPMPGWLGIRKGKMYIEGRDPVIFNEWLKQLRERRWPQIWEQRFLG
ncbi:hypothetical protein K432DRAFT_430523 [Lepidopterella palustris CBS 459.81]|uniref:Fungal STAND N-terminal Goodbye domain-containing protein n=1 Tax=Lepidopterella palustris CBS 459.81 TaxID=1314670 RepID=A0A8E2DXI5_9PEZI|nr:hypothetical protein K432DRAFT_430523 [Lepidopterella palustris CBS 459.81]